MQILYPNLNISGAMARITQKPSVRAFSLQSPQKKNGWVK